MSHLYEMVILRTDDMDIQLDDAIADKSTYIRGARSFSMTVDNKNEVDLTGVDMRLINNYINYLTGLSFEMDDDDREFFAFMGQYSESLDNREMREMLIIDRVCEDILVNIDGLIL